MKCFMIDFDEVDSTVWVKFFGITDEEMATLEQVSQAVERLKPAKVVVRNRFKETEVILLRTPEGVYGTRTAIEFDWTVEITSIYAHLIALCPFPEVDLLQLRDIALGLVEGERVRVPIKNYAFEIDLDLSRLPRSDNHFFGVVVWKCSSLYRKEMVFSENFRPENWDYKVSDALLRGVLNTALAATEVA